MKFAAAKEHRDFFRRQGWIEFEGLLNPDQLEIFDTALNVGLASRLSTTVDKLHRYPSEQLFMAGRDLWRANNGIKKVVFQSNLANAAAELIEDKPLRLAYDQFFPQRVKDPYEPADKRVYGKFLENTAKLEDVSCIDGLACGLMLCLSGTKEEESTEETSPDIFPKQAGNGIFFKTDFPFAFEKFYNHKGGRFFLIAYAQENAYYVLRNADPHTHVLKHMGYGFGDKLSGKLNPVLSR